MVEGDYAQILILILLSLMQHKIPSQSSYTGHLHKMQPCLVFIHRESSLVYHMYNDIKLTIIIARFVVMWYSMPPMYIYWSS